MKRYKQHQCDMGHKQYRTEFGFRPYSWQRKEKNFKNTKKSSPTKQMARLLGNSIRSIGVICRAKDTEQNIDFMSILVAMATERRTKLI